MKARLLTLSCLLLILCPAVRADYGWIPEYKKLTTKFGVDIYKTASNFDATGVGANLPSNGELSDTILSLSAEYGLVESWSFGIELPFFISAVDTASARIAENTGIGDITARLKWAVKPVNPVFTLEALLKFPTGSTGGTGGVLALGEGNFDFGLFLHSGHRGGSFLFSISPGVLARFNGYSLAAAGEMALQLNFARGYLRAFGHGIFSFQDLTAFDSSPTAHDAPGAAGSYSRLNGSPVGFSAGGKIGLFVTKEVGLEFSFTKGIYGSKYPNYFKAGGDIRVDFDFFEAPKSMKAKEVPFDFEYDKY